MKIFPEKTSKWYHVALFLLAVFIGLGLFALKEAEAWSYASDNPKACVNCHVMIPEYNSWLHSSHREWASCNDCHVPQTNMFSKYYFKAKDGILHASIFTAKLEPQVIRMRDESEEVVQANCVRCHVQQVTQTKYKDWIESHLEDRTSRKCWTCHREVVHGRVRGLSTVKYSIAPSPRSTEKNIIPKWLKKEIEKE